LREAFAQANRLQRFAPLDVLDQNVPHLRDEPPSIRGISQRPNKIATEVPVQAQGKSSPSESVP
jgi:hypothetical protein